MVAKRGATNQPGSATKAKYARRRDFRVDRFVAFRVYYNGAYFAEPAIAAVVDLHTTQVL